MEITGKIIQILPAETGEGRNGPWKKQNFVIETEEQYPRKVCITVWGDKVNLNNFSENELVTASINIESREYNGRWYTDVKAWRLVKEQTPDTLPGSEPPPPEKEPPDFINNGSGSDELPF